MPREGLLDPQGKAVTLGLNSIGLKALSNARVGKMIEVEIQADNADEAHKIAVEASEKLLANLIMESYTIQLKQK